MIFFIPVLNIKSNKIIFADQANETKVLFLIVGLIFIQLFLYITLLKPILYNLHGDSGFNRDLIYEGGS